MTGREKSVEFGSMNSIEPQIEVSATKKMVCGGKTMLSPSVAYGGSD